MPLRDHALPGYGRTFTFHRSGGFGSFGGSVSALQTKFGVTATVAGHGLEPSREGFLFAPSEQVANYYRPTPNHQPDAIIVHYREIPTVPSHR